MKKTIVPVLAALALLLAREPRARAGEPEVFEQARAGKSDLAKTCLRAAKKLQPRGCLLTMREYIRLGLWADPENKDLKKIDEFYAGMPPLPSDLDGFSWNGLAGNPILRKFKHKRGDDKDELMKFFGGDAEAIVLKYLEKAGAVSGAAADVRSSVGKDIFSLLDFFEESKWTGKFLALSYCRIQKAVDKAEEVLKGLGFVKKPRFPGSSFEKWFTPEEIEKDANEARRAEARKKFNEERARRMEERYAAIQKEVGAEKIETKSPFEVALGIDLKKWRSRHFQVEASMPDHQVKLCLAVQEAGFSELLNLLRLEDPGAFEPPVKSVLLGSENLYARWVREMSGQSPEEQEFTIKRTGGDHDYDRGYYVSERAEYDASMRDSLIGCTLNRVLARFGWTRCPLWIWLGLQEILTLEVLGTADTSYVSRKGTTGRQEDFDWFDYYRWKETMAQAEREKLAPSTDAILAFSNINELIDVQRAKMYCLARFLALEKLDAFKKLLSAISEKGWSRSPDGEFPALREAGFTIAELDVAYRAYLTR